MLNGTDIREIQELLGHTSVETTMIYAHVVRGVEDEGAESVGCAEILTIVLPKVLMDDSLAQSSTINR